MSETVGVAISTTGDLHRMKFLETAAMMWWRFLSQQGLPTHIAVTVDGSAEDAERVAWAVTPFAEVIRVGQPTPLWVGPGMRDDRCGVATNKNTGIEWLMDRGVDHLFLSDDDTWPLNDKALGKHLLLADPHSLVCWGQSRLEQTSGHPGLGFASWTWPRGVMMYTRRHVIEAVGGMDEHFGIGGHEHVEWSQRIHNAGFTRDPFLTPAAYALRSEQGGKAHGAARFWHCEDMRQPGETLDSLGRRRKKITSVRRQGSDWRQIEAVMAAREGSKGFVSYRAHANGRESATLFSNNPSRGAREDGGESK